MKADRQIMEKVRLALLSLQRTSWEQGVTALAHLELGLYDMAKLLAKSAAYRTLDDGRVAYIDNNYALTDPSGIGEVLKVFADRDGDEQLVKACDKMMFYLRHRAPRSIDGVLYQENIRAQIWIDSMYMGAPFMACMGEYDFAMQQVRGLFQYLYNEEDQLCYHIWDDDLGVFARKKYWGVGNGWAAAALVRLIRILPKERKADIEYMKDRVNRLLEGCVKWQREDGLYHDILDDPTQFVDANVAQMLAYTIYRGVKAGYVDEKYLAGADRSRAAAYGRVDEFGFVQGVCGIPKFDRSYIAPEAQAFFLMMEAAAIDLYGE